VNHASNRLATDFFNTLLAEESRTSSAKIMAIKAVARTMT